MTHVHDRDHHRLIYPWPICHWSQLTWSGWWWCLPHVSPWSLVITGQWSHHVSAGHRLLITRDTSGHYELHQWSAAPAPPHYTQTSWAAHDVLWPLLHPGLSLYSCSSQTGPKAPPSLGNWITWNWRRWCFNGHKKPASTDSGESVVCIHNKSGNKLLKSLSPTPLYFCDGMPPLSFICVCLSCHGLCTGRILWMKLCSDSRTKA